MTKKQKVFIGIGIGAVAIYFLIKPKTVTAATPAVNTLTNANTTNNTVTQLASGINTISNLFKSFTGGSSNNTLQAPSIIDTTSSLTTNIPTSTAYLTQGLSIMPVAPTITAISPTVDTTNTTDNTNIDWSNVFG